MDQPLWQTLFNIALIGFVARRAAFGLALQWDRGHPGLWGVYVALCAVCVFTGIAIQSSRRWVIAGLLSLVSAFAVATIIEIAVGVASAAFLILQLAIALAAGAALIVLAMRTPPEDSPSASSPH